MRNLKFGVTTGVQKNNTVTLLPLSCCLSVNIGNVTRIIAFKRIVNRALTQ